MPVCLPDSPAFLSVRMAFSVRLDFPAKSVGRSAGHGALGVPAILFCVSSTALYAAGLPQHKDKVFYA